MACLKTNLLFLLSLALALLLTHPTMAAPTPDLHRRGLLSSTLSLPAPHRRFIPETTANEAAVVPNVSVRHDVEEVEKRGLPPGGSGRPGSGSNYDKGKPYGRRDDEESEVA
ncbi:hypothetical protein BGZ95_002154 [Linnemannia exigua]|uniref:Uncharacterized protein n=1 Tax=Linnemannia exigua TaxID=604196 RepID=A0AAD4D5V6_9FUNG|nr:hypothetical protein BGZ95_002154 [Linnemannia exigua]